MLLLVVSIIIIFIISFLTILIINTLNIYSEHTIKINEAISNIENILKLRFDLLNKSINIMRKFIKDDSITLKTIDEIRNIKLSNHELDEKIYDALEEFHELALNHEQLKRDNEYTKIEIDFIESEAEIIALKEYYNDIIKEYNSMLKKFPYNFIGYIKKYKIKDKFKILDHKELIESLK